MSKRRARRRSDRSPEGNRARERQLLLFLFQWLIHEQPSVYDSGLPEDLCRRIERTYPQFSQQVTEKLPRLEELLADSRAQNMHIYLAPPSTGTPCFPILAVGYDFAPDGPKFCFRAALYTTDKKGETQVMGLRFECPQVAKDAARGVHDMYHAQLCTGFKAGELFEHCPDWLPTSQPSFPLNAYDSVTLLVALLVSLYGLEAVDRLKRASLQSVREGIVRYRDHLESLRVTYTAPLA